VWINIILKLILKELFENVEWIRVADGENEWKVFWTRPWTVRLLYRRGIHLVFGGAVSVSRGTMLNCANHLHAASTQLVRKYACSPENTSARQKIRLLANRPHPQPSHTSQKYIFLLRFILILFSSIYTKASQAFLHRVSVTRLWCSCSCTQEQYADAITGCL